MVRQRKITFSVNGFPVDAVYREENIRELFLPLVRHLHGMRQEKGGRLLVFLAAPPGAGKSTLAAFLCHLAKEGGLGPFQALGLDGFHYPQSYILSHEVCLPDGRTLPMAQVKGSPETYNLPHFRKKLEALKNGDPLWPVYDRRLHDVVEDRLPVSAPVVIVEGNWLLLSQEPWSSLFPLADFTIFIRAQEELLRERLILRKMQGGLRREEAEAFYRTGDGVNVRRALSESRPGSLNLVLDGQGFFHEQEPSCLTREKEASCPF